MSASARRSLRVGIIGCGYATTDRHLPALRRSADAEVVALADVDESAVRRVADEWGVARRYRSIDELVADAGVDAVAVCVPAAYHVEAASAALDAGKHVLVEKPLALSLAEADDLIARAAASPSVAAVGFNLRSHAQVRKARELVRAGTVGAVRSIHTTFTDPLLRRGRVPDWRRDRATGGGALFDKAIHHFDLWRFLVHDEVESVHAFTQPGDETVVATGRLRSGALGTAVASDVTRVRHDVVVAGDAGEIRVSIYRFDGLDVTAVDEIEGSPRGRLRRARSSVSQLVAGVPSIRRGGDFALSYDAQWSAFARAVRDRTEPDATLEDGRRALGVAVAAAKSADEGEAVRVDELLNRPTAEVTT